MCFSENRDASGYRRIRDNSQHVDFIDGRVLVRHILYSVPLSFPYTSKTNIPFLARRVDSIDDESLSKPLFPWQVLHLVNGSISGAVRLDWISIRR